MHGKALFSLSPDRLRLTTQGMPYAGLSSNSVIVFGSFTRRGPPHTGAGRVSEFFLLIGTGVTAPFRCGLVFSLDRART